MLEVSAQTSQCLPQVTTAAGEQGTIESSFGKSGKLKVVFPGGLAAGVGGGGDDKSVLLRCKRFIFASELERKKLRQ